MTAPAFLVVPEHVARNPIARAIERARVQQAVKLFAHRILGMPAGEECAGDLDASARVIAVALAVLEAYGMADDTLTAGLAALVDMARHSCLWKPEHASTVDAALLQAQDVFAQATATEVRLAWVRVGVA